MQVLQRPLGRAGLPAAAQAGARTLPAILPVLWTRILFPETADRSDASRWTSVLMVVLLPAVLLYPCLSFYLFEPDEGRYAAIPREMLARGEWIVPHLQGEPYLDKPPLFYWLVMLSYSVFGYHDWSARLVPALAVHGVIIAAYLFGRRLVGERSAFWGSLALALAPGFVSVGRLLVLDGLLALWTTVGLFAAYLSVTDRRGVGTPGRLRWGWWLTSAVACGLGILTKGPVILLLVFPPLVAHRWLTGERAGNGALGIGWRGLLAFAAVVAAIISPWYVAACLRMPEFARYFFWEHNVVRFVAPFDHERPIWFYAPVMFFGLLPAGWLAPALVHALIFRPSDGSPWRTPQTGFLLLAGGWCVLFFSLSGSKLPTYVLPAFPPLALALGGFIAGSRWSGSRWTATFAVAAVAILVTAHYVAIPWYAWFRSPMRAADAIVSYCSDPDTTVVCYPRNCDSVAFYLGRHDLRSYRSKHTNDMLRSMCERDRTVVIFTHRHSLDALRHALPPILIIRDEIPLNASWRGFFQTEFCYLAVIERVQ